MKKITGVLLALTFLLYLGGVQVMYWVRITVCKQESHKLIETHKVSNNNVVTFSFTPSEYSSLNWSEQNKEFTYQGQHYDIIGMQYLSDEIILNCYSDKDETDLIEAFSGFIIKMFSSPRHGNENSNDIANKLCKEYLATEYLFPPFFPRVLSSIEAKSVLVDASAKIDVIWHPPTIV